MYTTPSPVPPDDFDYLLALVAADQEVVEIIEEVFIQQWPLDLRKIQHALVSGDLMTVMHVAHALKGTLAMFGARPASQFAQAIERQAKDQLSEGINVQLFCLVSEVDKLLIAFERKSNNH